MALGDRRRKTHRYGCSRIRRIDEGEKATSAHAFALWPKCKCFEVTPVQIKDVDAFYGFLDDVGANKGVLISNSGFTNGAKKRADGSTLELETLTLEEAEDFDWADLLDHSCAGLDKCWGRMRWQFDDGSGSHAGHCDYCSTFHIKCGDCGYVDSYREDAIIHCNGCEARWRLDDEKGMTIGIERIDLDSDEEEDRLSGPKEERR